MTSEASLETARKWLHLAPGILAFAVRDLGYVGSVALTAALFAFNLRILPAIGGRRLWRRSEWGRGVSEGMLLYPGALTLLALATPGRPEVLAAGWGMLAFGDAAATLCGRRFGRRPLPWNREKSVVGAIAFAATSWVAIAALVAWTAPGRYPQGALLAVALLAAAVGALIESIDWRMDDNLSVTLLGGAVLGGGLLIIESGRLPAPDLLGAIAVALAAALAWWSRALDLAGAVAGFAVGLAVWMGTGAAGWLLLVSFVVLGGAATSWRASGAPPVRSWHNVVANGAVAAGCAVLAPSWGDRGVVAMAAALAAACADTVGGEIGRRVGGPTVRIPDRAPVPPGSDGGVSWAGSFATAGAAAAIAGVGAATGLLDAGAAGIVFACGVGGALLDSFLGGTLEHRGVLDNEGVNVLSTLVAAWAAASLA